MAVERILAIILPIYAIVAVGYLYARRWQPDMEAANRLNMDVFVPALVFHALSTSAIPVGGFLPLLGGALLIILGSGALGYPIARRLGIEPKTLLPTLMFNNSGNIGVPLAVLACGGGALPAAVLLLVMQTTLHFTLGVWILDRKAPILQLLRTPALVATAAGFLCNALGVRLPASVALPIEMLGNVAVPLMLLALGVRLVAVDLSAWRIGLLGALLRPLAGVAIFLLVAPLLPLSDLDRALLLLFATLPPAVMNFIFAERYGQEPAKVAAIVMMGNLLSVLTLGVALAFALDWTGGASAT